MKYVAATEVAGLVNYKAGWTQAHTHTRTHAYSAMWQHSSMQAISGEFFLNK